MKKCINCGNELIDEAKFCTKCGTTQPEQTETDIRSENTGFVSELQYEQNAGTGQPQQGYGQYQPDYNQYQSGYGQPQSGYGQPQQVYAQPQQVYGQPQQQGQFTNAIKDIHGQFSANFRKMGLSLFCLLGIIGAMLIIASPFMNFASLHGRVEYSESSSDFDLDDFSLDLGKSSKNINIKIKVNDGFNLFELMTLSNTVNRLADETGIGMGEVKDNVDSVEAMLRYGLRSVDEVDVNSGVINEIGGFLHLIAHGHVALIITPFLMILAGVGLLIFTVINNRKLKFVCAGAAAVAFIWLMLCSSHFFSMMGIGAWAMLIGIVLGVVSAFKDKV